MTRSRFLSLSMLATLAFVIAASSFPAHAQRVPASHTIIKFNVSGAGTGSGQGTIPFGIVADGSILGEYIDSSNVYHGFLRSAAGVITAFDAPGAGPGQSTFPGGINSALVIVGTYMDSSGVAHGSRLHSNCSLSFSTSTYILDLPSCTLHRGLARVLMPCIEGLVYWTCTKQA